MEYPRHIRILLIVAINCLMVGMVGYIIFQYHWLGMLALLGIALWVGVGVALRLERYNRPNGGKA